MTVKGYLGWATPSFSGAGQIDEGPFVFGDVSVLLRAKVRGAISYQGGTVGSSSILANPIIWGLYWVAHGAGPIDIITSADDEHILVRQQISAVDLLTTWALSTDTAAVLGASGLSGDWSGQLPIGASIDGWVSAQVVSGGTFGVINSFGTIENWWT